MGLHLYNANPSELPPVVSSLKAGLQHLGTVLGSPQWAHQWFAEWTAAYFRALPETCLPLHLPTVPVISLTSHDVNSSRFPSLVQEQEHISDEENLDVSADQAAFIEHVLNDQDDGPAGGDPTSGPSLLWFTVLSPSVDHSVIHSSPHPNWELETGPEIPKQFDLPRLSHRLLHQLPFILPPVLSEVTSRSVTRLYPCHGVTSHPVSSPRMPPSLLGTHMGTPHSMIAHAVVLIAGLLH